MRPKRNSAWKFLVKVLLANTKKGTWQERSLFFPAITFSGDAQNWCNHLWPRIMKRDLTDKLRTRMQKDDSTWVPDDVLKLLKKLTLHTLQLLPRLPACWDEMKNPYCLSHFELDVLLLTVEITLTNTHSHHPYYLTLGPLSRLLSAFSYSSLFLQTHITSEPTVWMLGSLMRSPPWPPSTRCQPRFFPWPQIGQSLFPCWYAVKYLPQGSLGYNSMHVVSVC